MSMVNRMRLRRAFLLAYLFPFLLILLHHVYAKEDPVDEEHKVETVTYGSIIKLEHVETGYRLHSHEIAYGSGSRQQSVTCHSSTGDSNSLWIIKSELEKPAMKQGTQVKCGDTIRLQHVNTGKNLHSHLHQAPKGRDKEVSAYAKEGEMGIWNDGDSGDNWELICGEDEIDKGVWRRFASVALRNVDTMNYLSSSKSNMFGHPIPGQLQVDATSKNTKKSKWKTNEGVYFAPH